MDNAEFVQKTNAIAEQMDQTTDTATKVELMTEFFAVGVQMWNEHIAGEAMSADGQTVVIERIEQY